MLKIALIPPINNLSYALQGDMLMALTQIVLKNKAYAKFYADSEMYKILDNGAFEDELHSIKDVLKAAEIINANEIILPDVLFDKEKTLKAVDQALIYLNKNKLLDKDKLMAVPQGSTEDEWWECYEKLEIIPEVNVIGLSKLSCPKCFNNTVAKSRIHITSMVSPMPDKEYHLLGGSFEVLEEVKSHPNWIRSIDTSAPFEFGKRRIYLDRAVKDYSGKAKLEIEVKKWNKSYVDINVKLLKAAL